VQHAGDGRGSWGTSIDVPIYAVESIELVHDESTLSADLAGAGTAPDSP
jgi:hypothetical protein